MKAIWNNTVIAESNNTIIVEGNHYFPTSAISDKYLENSETKSICPWKGEASYYQIVVDGLKNIDAAWYYSEPKYAASNIKNYVAFWRGVEIRE